MWFSTARIRPMIGVASLALACLACPTVANAQERYTPNKPAESQLVIPAADVRVAQAPMPVEMPPVTALPAQPPAPVAPPTSEVAQPAAPAAPPASPTGDPVLDAKILAVIRQHEAEKKAAEEAAKKAEEEKKQTEGYVVGSDTRATAKFENGWLWIRTANNDFNMHIGYWMQMDAVWWNQSAKLRTPQDGRPGHAQGVASGIAAGGIGDLEDGFFFRRIRPFIEGTFYEVFEYRLNLALENNQFQTAGLDEFWVGWNKLPVIGTVRLGHIKNAMGLEGDMSSSSRCMTFMERSSYSEAIELNQNFGTGLYFGNAFLDDRVTYQATLVRPDNGFSSGTFFGDGQWGWNIRATALPLFECDGRQLMHIGASIGWRNGTNNLSTSSDRVFQLRARPEMRDDDPAGSSTAGINVPDANSFRMIDTGVIAAHDDWILGLEYLYIHGPFSFQAEYGWNYLIGAYGVAPTGFTLHPAIVPPQNYTFQGGYLQVAYTLTGENRAYDKHNGALARDYFRNGPYTNAWFTRDCDGGLNWGWGAWELAARWSYTNLNNGVGLNQIKGGIMQGLGIGVNWYLNRDLKVQFDWNYNYRYSLPTGTIPGFTSGYGIETQLSF